MQRPFGNVRQRDSGRWQARYRRGGRWYTAAVTFSTEKLARRWLDGVRVDIERNVWTPPGATVELPMLRAYAAAWLAERELATTTREHYAQLLRDHIYPSFGDDLVTEITPARVRQWHAGVARARKGTKVKDRPTARAHAYGLLRTIMATAVADELIAANPCRVRAGGQAKTTKKMLPATLDELAVIVRETPDRFRLMVQLAVWCSLRFGELAELRRSDVDVKAGVVRVRRGVVRTLAGRIAKTPKSEAGIRDVTIPSHVLDDLRAHQRVHTAPGRHGLLFPAGHGGHLAPSSAYRWFYPARAAAGRPDLRFHDLRHTGQTYAAYTGANLPELMARAGQSSPGAALRYLHEVAGRQREIAEQLAGFATSSNVTPIGAAKGKTRPREGSG